ncbi:MAG TPA: hypothetical protein VHH73_17205, partial [Verrucomicrobiae bacterium]|nr:hypothetical protein [Verrucomicrobiae bacterium]
MSTTKNTSRIALLPPSLALFFVMVFSLLVLFPARAANMDIPLLPADYSVFESLPGDGQSKSNTRTLTFPVPQGLTPLSAPFTVVGPTYVTCLKSPEPLALVRFVTA